MTDTGSSVAWPTAAQEQPVDEKRWWALAVVLTGGFMIVLDSTIVNVAIPPIQVDLGAGYSTIEWVVSGYALAYGLLLIPAGRLGDRFGYRPLFILGLLGFTLTSVFCGTADDSAQLVAWRVLQGAAAGVLNPQILAIIQVAFPPAERGRAYSAYGAVSGVAVALGPLLGGLLIYADIQGTDWRPIFLINVPIGLVALLASFRLLPSARGRGGSLDVVGVLLVSAAVLLVTVPLIEGGAAGWPAWSWALLVAALPVAAAFGLWEARRKRAGRVPLVDVSLFVNRGFSGGVAVGLTYFAGFIGLFFALSLYLQLGLGRSALAAGLILLPFAAGAFVGAAFSDRVTARLGRTVLMIGSAAVAAGTLGILVTVRRLGVDVSGPELVPSLLVAGVGSGLVISPNVNLVLATVPWQDSGAASGVLNTAQRVGNALGVALVGVALFGALGTAAPSAAQAAAPQLRTSLAAAGLPAADVEAGVSTFTRCFVEQSTAADPTAVPTGCPAAGRVGDPVASAFAGAADQAQRRTFTAAIEASTLVALAALVTTFLLAFALPRGRPEAGRG